MDIELVTGFFQCGRPFKGDRCVRVDFDYALCPFGLMGKPAAQALEPVTRNDLWRAEVLEFGSVGASLLGQADQLHGPPKIAIVIGGDIGDEIGGMVPADQLALNADLHVQPFSISDTGTIPNSL